MIQALLPSILPAVTDVIGRFLPEDKEAKAMFLSFWDTEKSETLKMDLWVKEMPINDMKLFFYQNLVSLGETYFKATNDNKNYKSIKNNHLFLC